MGLGRGRRTPCFFARGVVAGGEAAGAEADPATPCPEVAEEVCARVAQAKENRIAAKNKNEMIGRLIADQPRSRRAAMRLTASKLYLFIAPIHLRLCSLTRWEA